MRKLLGLRIENQEETTDSPFADWLVETLKDRYTEDELKEIEEFFKKKGGI